MRITLYIAGGCYAIRTFSINPKGKGSFMILQSEALPQNIKKVAILIDWENLRKTFDTAIQRYNIKKEQFTYNNVDKLLKFIKFFVNPDEEIYRIFFYLTTPKDKAEWKGQIYSIEDNPQYEKVYKNSVNFINNLRLNDYV